MNKQTEALNGLKHLESISAQLKTYSDGGQWTHIPSHLSAGHCYEIAKEMDNVIQACKEALEQELPEDAELESYKQGYEQGKFDALMDAELKKSVYKFDHPDYGELTQIPEQPAPKNCTSLDDFIAELEKDPEFKEVMKQQRAKLLALLESPQPAQEPVAVVYSMQDGYVGQMVVKDIPHKTKLYTHPAPSQWISVKDRLPEVKSGNAKEFIVVIYSGYTGRSFVTSRHFLNKMELYNEYSDNDFDEVSGWHERTYHLEYDDYYTLVDSCNADAVRYEVTHWMPLPDAPKE